MRRKGFTLVELLVSVAIIGIVTSIVLVKYGSFDSTVLLKDTAYEIALSLREAQVKSLSSVSGNAGFDFPYGMTFSVANATEQKRYRAFQYATSSETLVPKFVESGGYISYPKTIGTTTIGRSMQVSDICVTISNLELCDVGRLDISFRRPEFKALFYTYTLNGDGSSTLRSSPAITNATIKVNSVNGGAVFLIKVSQFGQITVQKE